MISLQFIFRGTLFLIAISLQGTVSTRLSRLTKVHQEELAEFREMTKEVKVSHEFMKDDAYLLRYLMAKDFDVNAAAKNFQHVLESRKTANVDSVMKEDWSEYEKRFPISVSTVNKKGNPILYLPFGKWAIANEMQNGDAKKFTKYMGIKILEVADRKAQAIRTAGNKDVAQFDAIVDFDGYTIEKQGCLSCIKHLMEIAKIGESLYAEANDKTYFINTPVEYKALLPILLSAFANKESYEKINVLGGQEEFEPVLLKNVELKEFPEVIRKH